MKINKMIVLLLVCLLAHGFTSPVSAQRLKVKQTSGKAFKGSLTGVMGRVHKMSKHNYLSISGEQPAYCRSPKRGYQRHGYIEFNYLDDDLMLNKKVVPKFRIGDKSLIYEGLARMKKGYLIFMSYDNIKRKKLYLFAAWYDPDNLTFQSDPVRVAEIKMAERGYMYERFKIEISGNGETFMVFGYPPEKAERTIFSKVSDEEKFPKFDLWVYNDGFELLNYRKGYRLEHDGETRIQIAQVTFDEEGNIYVLGGIKIRTISKRRKFSLSRKTSYEGRYVIKQLRPDMEEQTYEPESAEVIIEGIMRINPDGRSLTFVGVEGKTVKGDFYVTSLMYSKLAIPDFTQESTASMTLPDKLYDIKTKWEEKRGERRASKRSSPTTDRDALISGRYISNYGGIAFFDVSNEGVPVIVLEQKEIRIVTTETTDASGNTSTRTTTYYHYKDAIVCSIVNDAVDGMRIFKNHYLTNYDIGTEITGGLHNDELYLIADKDVYQMNIKTAEFQSGRLQLATTSGKLKKNRRKPKGSINITFISVSRISENEFIAFQKVKRRKQIMHKITF